MGFWSSIKHAVTKTLKRWVKTIVRTIVKIVITIVHLVIGIVGSIFLFWMQKKLRVHVCILHAAGDKELVSVSDAQQSVDRAAVLIKQRFNTKVLHYGTPYVEVIKEAAPTKALDTECNVKGNIVLEFGDGGDFYAHHLAGWNAIPVSLTYPVTIFVVRSIKDGGDAYRGCSAGLFTDYVVLTPDGITDDTTLAHEIGHACFLLHRKKKNNLMFHGFDRGTSITGWQKYWFRASRHVNFW